MKINNIIHSPIVTEKSLVKKEGENRYTFKVAKNATKAAIAKELSHLFNVDVLDVKTLITRGKAKRLRKTRFYTTTPAWKKAIVKIKDGQKIDLFPES